MTKINDAKVDEPKTSEAKLNESRTIGQKILEDKVQISFHKKNLST